MALNENMENFTKLIWGHNLIGTMHVISFFVVIYLEKNSTALIS